MEDPRGPARTRVPGETIEQFVVHPVLERAYVCAEHPEGQVEWLGDAIGTDFMVVRFDGHFARMFDGDGSRNEDWYGWRSHVLAPFEGTVTNISHAAGVNQPGRNEGGKPGGLIFERDDGVFVAYGHVDEFEVTEGERVRAGQRVGRVSNNGTSWMPHLHVGAWRGETPLQICIDLAVLGRLVEELGEEIYYGFDVSSAAARP